MVKILKESFFLICFHVTYYHMKNLEFSTTEGSFLEFFFFPLSKTIFKYVIAAQKQKNKPAHSAMMALHLPEENENKTIDEAVSSPVEPRRERC